MSTFGAVWRSARDRFRAAGIGNAEREALLLAEDMFGLIPDEFPFAETQIVQPAQLARYEGRIERRLGGEPVARILGRWEFYGLEFDLGPDTLVPRPDTELIVDIGLEFIKRTGATRLLDLGAGSGCIAISLLVERPEVSGVATDLSAGALATARGNAGRFGVLDRLDLRQGSWFDAVEAGTTYDLIVSNPPYIESAVIPTLMVEVREHDPLLALDGGADGLAPYREIAARAGAFLRPGGLVAIEIGAGQAGEVSGLFLDAGFGEVSIRKDLAGLDRAIVAHQL